MAHLRSGVGTVRRDGKGEQAATSSCTKRRRSWSKTHDGSCARSGRLNRSLAMPWHILRLWLLLSLATLLAGLMLAPSATRAEHGQNRPWLVVADARRLGETHADRVMRNPEEGCRASAGAGGTAGKACQSPSLACLAFLATFPTRHGARQQPDADAVARHASPLKRRGERIHGAVETPAGMPRMRMANTRARYDARSPLWSIRPR